MTELKNEIQVKSPYRIVLCRTEGPGNLGSVCRAMKAMGFRELVLVNPSPKALVPEMVREMALHAFDLFEEVKVVPTLSEALGDCRLSAAFARRQGGLRKTGFMDLPDFQKMIDNNPAMLNPQEVSGPIALVFGNEKHGLDKEEVSKCTLSVQIPTHPDFPSLNLSQAVQIVCWELRQIHADRRRTKKLQMGEKRRSSLQIQDFQNLGEEVVSIFQGLGFYHLGGHEKAQELWRDLFTRAGLDETEAAWIKGTFGKLRGIRKV